MAKPCCHLAVASVIGVLLCDNPATALQAPEAYTKGLSFFWWTLFFDLKRPEPYRVATETLQLTWSKADETIDRLCPHFSVPTRPRGETTEGFAFSAEFFSWCVKLAHVLASGAEAEVEADTVLASLPSWEEHLAIVCARYVQATHDAYHTCSVPQP